MKNNLPFFILSAIIVISSSWSSGWGLNPDLYIWSVPIQRTLLLISPYFFWFSFITIGLLNAYSKKSLGDTIKRGLKVGVGIGLSNSIVFILLAQAIVAASLVVWQIEGGDYIRIFKAFLIGGCVLFLYHLVFWIFASIMLGVLAYRASISVARSQKRSKELRLSDRIVDGIKYYGLPLSTVLIWYYLAPESWIQYPIIGFLEGTKRFLNFWLLLIISIFGIYGFYSGILNLMTHFTCFEKVLKSKCFEKNTESSQRKIVQPRNQYHQYLGKIKHSLDHLDQQIKKNALLKFCFYGAGSWVIARVLSSVLDWVVQNALIAYALAGK